MSETVPEGWVRGNFEQLSAVRKTKYQPQTNSVEFAYVGLEHLGSSSRKIKEFGSSADIVSTKTKFLKGDTLFGKLRPYLRKVAYPDCDGVCSTDILALSPTRSADPVFLYYTCASDKFIANAVESSAGNVMPRASWDDLACLQIQIPPLIEQKKIASILTSVDEVIENTQRQIDKLQELKKATMNELLTKGIGHTEFKDSELGRIPKSWEVMSIENYVSVGRGYAFKSSDFCDSGDPIIRVTNISTDNLLDLSKDVFYLADERSPDFKSFRLKDNDFLLVMVGATVGKYAVVQTLGKCLFLNQNMWRLRTKDADRHSQQFAIFALQKTVEEFLVNMQGSARDFLTQKEFGKAKVALPDLEEQQQIQKIISGIERQVSVINHRLVQTQSLKKSLMQDLLTGKVRVQV